MNNFYEKEKDILKAITDYLSLLENQKKLYFVRVGSGGIKTEAGNWVRTGRPGCPDIIICLKCGEYGIMVGWEVKTEKGKLSSAQEKTKVDIENLGGYYFVIRNLEDSTQSIKYVREKVLNLQKDF